MSQIPQLMSGRALEHGISLMVDHGGESSKKMHVISQANADVADGSALNNSTDETALASYTIPKNTLVTGSTIRIRAAGILSAHATGNATIQLKLDTSDTAIGSAESIATTGSTGSLNANDIYDFDSLIQVRTAGSSGTAVGVTNFSFETPTTAGEHSLKPSFTLDTTKDNIVQITGEFAAANAGNTLVNGLFVGDVVNPST